jgi:hypothetical protein
MTAPLRFFTGECISPDFNLCDYAFGFDWIEFGDRYFRCPNYLLYESCWDISKRLCSNVDRDDLRSKKFCNFIYSNGNGVHPYRDDFFER